MWTPVCSKSITCRVTTAMPCTRALAAVRASRSHRLSGIGSLAQRCAMAVSTGNMRSENSGITHCFNHARRTALWAASLRSIDKTPYSSSSTVTTDMNRLAASTLSDHSATARSAFPFQTLRNSDTTLASRINIRRRLPA